MSLVLLALGAVALSLPGLRPGLTLRGHPAAFVVLNATSLVLGLAAISGGLALAAGVGVLHLVSGSSLLWFEGHLAPGGLAGSAASSMGLAAIVRRGVGVLRHARAGTRRARADRWLGLHQDFGDHEVVVLPTADAVAYSVGGSPPQVVISEGLWSRLDDDLAAFVVEHERAHLRRGDRRWLLVAAVAEALFGVVPPVARSTLVLRVAVERAADESAAGADLDRRRRLADALRGNVPDAWNRSGSEALRYRTAQLEVEPRRVADARVLGAGAGLAALLVVAFASASHAGGDLPQLLAAVR